MSWPFKNISYDYLMEIIFSLKNSFSKLEDPRVIGRTKHNLVDILVLSALACICHAENWVEIEDFGKAKHSWLKSFLELPNGIPSHDTIGRVFSLIDPKCFEYIFISWINEVRKKIKSETICIDGKNLKGTIQQGPGFDRDRVNTVNVWSTEQGLVLGQMKTKNRINEADTVLELLDLINVKGVTIVGDAGIGLSKVANKIRKNEGNYVFPIKGNNKKLLRDVTNSFKSISEKRSQSKKVETSESKDKGHGRNESRYCTIIRKENFPPEVNKLVNGQEQYHDLKVIGRLVYESEEKETRPFIHRKTKSGLECKVTVNKRRKNKEIRYFISSLDLTASEMMEKLRLQWAIENQLHWVLDVSMGEDGHKARDHIAAANFSLIRKIALNFAKQDKTKKLSMRRKLKMAGWDTSYLETLLFKKSLS